MLKLWRDRNPASRAGGFKLYHYRMLADAYTTEQAIKLLEWMDSPLPKVLVREWGPEGLIRYRPPPFPLKDLLKLGDPWWKGHYFSLSHNE